MSIEHEPDLGLLAEYAEGLLDGTPAAAAVAHRITTDERWERADADLRAALGAVRHDLATLGAAPRIPPGVATRLEAALDDLRPSGVVPLRRRRRRRMAVIGVGVAAAAALVVGFPLSPVLLNEQSPTTSVSIPETIGDTRITHSGKNYGPEVGAASQQSARGVEAAPDLTRLNDPAALARCLEAVQHLTGSAPLSADFGSVRSSPALVVTFPGGSRVAVGASCDLGRPDVLTRLVDTP